MAQDRLDELAMISIENEEAKQLNVDDLIDKFAEKNARRKQRFAEWTDIFLGVNAFLYAMVFLNLAWALLTKSHFLGSNFS